MSVEAVRDLTSRTELTLDLLDDTRGWRERLVETFEFRSTHYVRVRSSYQIRLDRGRLGLFGADPGLQQVRVRLPVTTRPKRSLVGFNVTANDVRGHLPLRTTIADVQTAYLMRLAERSAAREVILSGLDSGVLRAIASFTPGVFLGFRRFGPVWGLTRYLRSGLSIDVGLSDVVRWQSLLRETRRIIPEVLGERPDPFSSAEQFLLAVPLVTPTPDSTAKVEELVGGYASAVSAAHGAEDVDFLEVLGEYGRRWEMFVDALVPVNEPFLVKIHEDRPLGLRLGGYCKQLLWAGDARSYHLEVRTVDPAVVLGRGTKVLDPLGNKVGFGWWEGRRLTRDAVSLYGSDPDRPYFVELVVRLRPAWSVRTLAATVETLALLAIAVIAFVDLGEDRLGKLAVLSVPTSFAMALLATREQTSLAAHVQRFTRTRMLMELIALWAVSVHQLIFRSS